MGKRIALGVMGLGVGPVGGDGEWTPALPTTDGGYLPEHWYRSDDAYQDAARTTPVALDGDVVGSLTDLTANADHVSQAATGNKPTWQNGVGDLLNGQPVIRCDGIDDYLVGAFTSGGLMAQPNTVFVVGVLDVAAVNDDATNMLVDGDDSTHRHLVYESDPAGAVHQWTLFAGANLGWGTVSDSSWHMFIGLFNSTSSEVWVDGGVGVVGNAGTQDLDGRAIGGQYNGQYPWLGDFVELLDYEPDLSDADKNEIGGYLAARYGLTFTPI